LIETYPPDPLPLGICEGKGIKGVRLSKMYKSNWFFDKPKNENAKIWRYMDFTKFVSLLDKSSLFFTRADKLNDPFEGSCPENVVRYYAKKEGFNYLPEFYQELKKFTFVNCWHLNEYESAALWKLYLKSNEGIAIQSNFVRLKNSFKDEEHDIFIGKVRYTDYTTCKERGRAFAYPILYKRKLFKHEEELRAVISTIPKTDPPWKPTKDDGIYVHVDLDILIDKIYLAPISPKWHAELLQSLIQRYHLAKEVKHSDLDSEPSLK
jgi:hypothetical protein